MPIESWDSGRIVLMGLELMVMVMVLVIVIVIVMVMVMSKQMKFG